MPNVRAVVLDIEVVTQDAHAERLMAEPFPADTWKPSGNASKPETIAAQKERAEAEWDAGREARCDALCLSPRTGRIVMAVLMHPDIGKGTTALWVEDTQREHVILTGLWQYIHESQTLVTFNGFAFDLPYLIVRSALLGVRSALPPQRLTGLLRRYQYSPHFDVRMALTAWDMRGPGTKAEWAAAFGLTSQDGSGADVGRWHRAGEHAKIAAHCKADVEETHAMYLKLAPFYGAQYA